MRKLSLFILSLALVACLDPTVPEFQLEEAFYLVEGRILAGEQGSEIRVQESDFREANKQFLPVARATVLSREEGGEEALWELDDAEKGTYIPPAGFTAAPGQTWHFDVVLPDGTVIESTPETIPEPVLVNALNIRFEQNAEFDEGRNRFIPRFEIFLDYDDPADRENFYAFDYRYWEKVIVCATCEFGRWRNGECLEDPFNFRFDYLCDTDECFSLTQGVQTIYGNDELTNGSNIRDFEVGGVEFDVFGIMLVEGILLSITPEAYDYGKVIQDLTTGNSGLNATIPSALNGNVRNVDPDGKTVLGYLGAASTGRLRNWVERNIDVGTPLPFDNMLRLEPSVGTFVPPRAPCEVDGRSAQRPEGWPE